MKRLLFLISNGSFFLSHRLQLALDARQAGYEVAIACPTGESAARFAALGLRHLPIVMQRKGSTALSEIRTIVSVHRAIGQFNPDLIHLITAKPIIYGGAIARIRGIPTVSAVSGLGHVFVAQAPRIRLLRALVVAGYKVALNHPRSHAIFQNTSDLATFRSLGIVTRGQHSLIPGSGADLDLIRPQPLPDGDTVLILPARLIFNKGVQEFVDVARMMKARGVRAVFRLVGNPDPGNPTSVPEATLRTWMANGDIEWVPYTPDIGAELARAHIVVLPSHGGEGIPKTLIDAAAAGRAGAASDVPGCRDAIAPGLTGVLFAAKDAADMARVLEPLIRDRNLQAAMGQAARARAEAMFDLRDVSATHQRIYAAQLPPRRQS